MSSLTSRCAKGGLLALAILAVTATLIIGFYSAFGSVISKYETHNIVFVNWGARTDVDESFENYLRRNGVKYNIKYYSADRSEKKLSDISAQLLSESTPNDLVVTWGTTVTLGVFGSVKKPILQGAGIFVLVANPVGAGIILSPEDSGRNLTGSWHLAPVANQLRSMMAYKPAKKIGILYTPSEENSLLTVKEMQRQAAIIGIEVVAIPFDFRDGIPVSANTTEALEEMKARGCEWLYLPPDSFLSSQARNLVLPEANRLGFLTFASGEQLMMAGAMAGLIAPYAEIGEIAGEAAVQILINKKSPSSIPSSTVKRFHHVINPTLAKRHGIDLTNPLFADVIRVPE